MFQTEIFKSGRILKRFAKPSGFRLWLIFACGIAILQTGCSKKSENGQGESSGSRSTSTGLDSAQQETSSQPISGTTTAPKLDSTPRQNGNQGSNETAKTVHPATIDETPQPGPREIMNTTQGLNKNQTILLIYAHPDVRADVLMSHLAEFLSPEQRDQAFAISMKFDEEVAKIRNERSEILENATDDQDVDRLLLENRRKMFELFTTIRKKIFMDVLTKEQKQKVAERNAKLKEKK